MPIFLVPAFSIYLSIFLRSIRYDKTLERNRSLISFVVCRDDVDHESETLLVIQMCLHQCPFTSRDGTVVCDYDVQLDYAHH